MAVSLATPSQIEIQIGFGRSRRDFSERDRLLLNLVRPHLVQAYQNAQAITEIQKETALLRRAMEMGNQGVVVLAKEGRIRLMTRQARAWLTEYFGSRSQSSDYLPETLRSWITHQETQLAHADDAPPSRTPLVLERDGARLVVRHLCEAEQCLLFLEERQTTVLPASLEPLGLTRRKTEVLHWVAQGKTNAEIAAILGLSPRTVQTHLEHIFKKLGVETRTAAATLALGWRPGAEAAQGKSPVKENRLLG
ncbi:MAG: helix-turn-helix transcriptional regulator [candidate division NC10 bacterium]|nr:helix-turn-helix transcriptional regulator [candidate division NC10 bacterium]MDE2322102.1 helix-turn-helix transcriptional regulator [candidate division NC10 bacterium]